MDSFNEFNNKRNIEDEDTSGLKRVCRPEDIMVGSEDSRVAVTRLLVNKSQFSKIIGKGGQTANHIRFTYQVTLKCSDIAEDEKLVILDFIL